MSGLVATAVPIVIAHRGASASAPEHTYAAYDRALAQGADYIELDVQRTKDGALVVIHDATLDRTARGASADCTGRVAEKTLAQLETCDAGSWFNSANPTIARTEFAGLRIPTLVDVIARYAVSARLYIETKDPESYPGIEAELVAILRAHGIAAGSTALPRVYIQSFSRASLQRVHELDAALPLIQLFGPLSATEIISQLSDVRSYAAGVGLLKEDVSASIIAPAHAKCLLVHAYTVDDSSEMLSLLGMGVDGIFTDRPDLMREMVDRNSSRTAGVSGCGAVVR